ncbi:exosome complex exonuclease RRP6, partial [Strigomonas culicis]
MKEYSKAAAALPLDDYEYHEAFPGFRKRIRDHSVTLIQLMDSCCGLLPKRRRVSILEEHTPPHAVPTLNETQRTVVMEAIDSYLENVDSLLDEVRGNKMSAHEQLAVHFGGELTIEDGSGNRGGGGGALRTSRGVMRPQLTFATPVDNSDRPFTPVYDDAEGRTHTGTPAVHPFAEQIQRITMPEGQMVHQADTPPVPLDTCPLKFVDTVEGLKETVARLLHETEIAVDLEHHDFYSYLGFTCLMQISTRTEDIIIDCLKLRSSMRLLSSVFLHPHILKVFHGAREDVRWLQKDFGLYLINFFDTGLALQALHMPYSLAFAVDHFCQVKLDKQYQTADWRVRPIPAVMVHYARQDTHYLLYIYDRLKALLLNSETRASVGNLLRHVYQESRQLSLELYEKPRLDPAESYKAALYRSLGGLSPLQETVAREVFNWRDAVARTVDDSPAAVLQLSGVLAIACNLPTTVKDVLKCCNPI